MSSWPLLLLQGPSGEPTLVRQGTLSPTPSTHVARDPGELRSCCKWIKGTGPSLPNSPPYVNRGQFSSSWANAPGTRERGQAKAGLWIRHSLPLGCGSEAVMVRTRSRVPGDHRCESSSPSRTSVLKGA